MKQTKEQRLFDKVLRDRLKYYQFNQFEIKSIIRIIHQVKKELELK